MAKEVHKGGSPKNARIKINYQGKKPIVRFSYPSKRDQKSGSMFSVIFIFYFIILFLVSISLSFSEDPGALSISFLVIAFMAYVCAAITYYPFKKSIWNDVYPKWQAFQERKKIKKFTSKDVKHSEELGYYCEVPVFNNIVLNFDARKEFSKYLEEFEIEEHKFKYYFQRRKRARKVKGKYKAPKSFNEWLWYARFYFKEKPKTGFLIVVFK